MKRHIRAVAFLLCLLILLQALTGCTAARKPLLYLRSGVRKALEERLGGSALALFLSAIKEGQVGISYGGSGVAGAPLDAFSLTYTHGSGTVAPAAFSFLCVADGKSYDGNFLFRRHEATFSSDAFLGGETLGVDILNAEHDLKNSIFRNNSGTQFTNPRVDEQTAGKIKGLESALLTLLDAGDDAETLRNEIVEDFLKSLAEYAVCTRYIERGVVYISLRADNETIALAFRATYDKLAAKKSFSRTLRTYAAALDTLSSIFEIGERTHYDDAVAYWFDNTANIEALCEKVRTRAPFSCEMSAEVRRLTGTLRTIRLTVAEEENTLFALSLDISQKNAMLCSLTVGGTSMRLSNTVEKNSRREYRSAFTLSLEPKGAPNVDATGTVVWNRRTGAWQASLSHGEQTRVFDGNFTLEKKAFRFSLETITQAEASVPFSLTVFADTKAQCPPLEEYVNLPSVTEARFAPIAERAKATYATLCEQFGDTLPRPRAFLLSWSDFFCAACGIQI